MNIRALNKLDPIYVKMDWSECIDSIKLSDKQIRSLLDIIDNFKDKKSIKELVLFKYRHMPLYVTVVWNDIPVFLDWLIKYFLKCEDYESCKRISDIRLIIKKSLINKKQKYDYSSRNTYI